MISREIRISPVDDWKRIVERAPSRTRVLFSPGRYSSERARINQDYVHLVALEQVIMPDCTLDFTGDNGMVKGFEFTGGSSVNARFESNRNYDKIAQGLIITHNVFRHYQGYAKRIRIASNMSHHLLPAYCSILYNTFDNIDGRNNKGKPGGELISVKASNCVVIHNTVANCRGRLSIRGGNGSVMSCNIINSDMSPYGIQIYGEGHILHNNVLGEYGELRIGDGDSRPSDQKKGRNHVAADWAQVMLNQGTGRIIIQRRYRRYRPQHVHLADNALEVIDQWE